MRRKLRERALHVDAEQRQALAHLRMGQEPYYTFNFVVAEHRDGALRPVLPPRFVGERPDLGRGLAWLGRRLLGEPLPPPR